MSELPKTYDPKSVEDKLYKFWVDSGFFLSLIHIFGRICAEFVMCYPPGIPILAPGERITRDILDYIRYAKEKNCMPLGTEDPEVNNLQVIRGVVSPE